MKAGRDLVKDGVDGVVRRGFVPIGYADREASMMEKISVVGENVAEYGLVILWIKGH